MPAVAQGDGTGRGDQVPQMKDSFETLLLGAYGPQYNFSGMRIRP